MNDRPPVAKSEPKDSQVIRAAAGGAASGEATPRQTRQAPAHHRSTKRRGVMPCGNSRRKSGHDRPAITATGRASEANGRRCRQHRRGVHVATKRRPSACSQPGRIMCQPRRARAGMAPARRVLAIDGVIRVAVTGIVVAAISSHHAPAAHRPRRGATDQTAIGGKPRRRGLMVAAAR